MSARIGMVLHAVYDGWQCARIEVIGADYLVLRRDDQPIFRGGDPDVYAADYGESRLGAGDCDACAKNRKP